MKKIVIATIGFLLIAGVSLYAWLGYEIKQGQQHTANGTNDYVIILGAKVKPGGVPSLSLKNRLDEAIPYLQQHTHVTVIVSGGQGHDEDRTEASVMAAYLMERGVDKQRILLEEQATSTYENLVYSKELLPADVTSVTVISNDFHLRRASFLANELGLDVDVIAADTPSSVALKSNIRERLALLKAFVFKT